MIDILLKILIALFAVFGLYVFVHALGTLCFRNNNIKLMILVDSREVAEQIEMYFEEAKNASFLYGRTNICPVVMEKYATKELLQTLSRKRISYQIAIDQDKTA